MRIVLKVEGLRELQAALEELPKATSRNVVRRALMNALKPMEAQAEALAPSLTGQLRSTIETSAKLSRRQKAQHAADIGAKTVKTAEGYRSTPQTTVFMFMGPASSAKSIVQEFGSVHQSPQPYMRPTWDSGAMAALKSIKDEFATELEKARARLARKAAKLAAK